MTASTEVAVRRPQGQAAAMPAKLQYAHELANSGLLPTAYRRNPGNVLWAVEFGEMLGLPPMAAITGVHVIEGKPTASAGLISALVRRAGHKLRVRGDGQSATCEIVRADDPEYTFSVTFTMDDAEKAKLTGKPVWKQYGASMLKARAITQCARDACEEALFGLHYTPEELGAEVDEEGGVVGGQIVDDAPVQVDGQGTADDPWYVRPSPEQEWLAKALEDAPGRDLDGCKADWQAAVKHVNDGSLTRQEAGRLQDVLRPRIKTLMDAEQQASEPPCDSDVVEGVIVPDLPEDWRDKIADISDGDAADAVITEATRMLGAEEMDADLYARITVAVEGRLDVLGVAGRAAA